MEPSTRARADIQTKAKTDPKLAAQLAWSATQDAKYAPSTPTSTPLTGIASTQAAKNTIADVSSSAIKSPIGNLLSSQNTLNTAPGITTLKGPPDITTQSLTAPPANAKLLDPYTTMGATGIAGNPNVGSFTSADNMNTSATGVGAPITSLLPSTTSASGTSTVTTQPQQLPASNINSAAAYNANVNRISDLQNTFTSRSQMNDWYAAHPEDSPNNIKPFTT
jgi:hypothetical protein